MDKLIDDIINGKYKNIIIVSGAGVSTNSGIPDFRSSSHSIFYKVKEDLNLSQPETLLSREFYDNNKDLVDDYLKPFKKCIRDVSLTDSHELCKALYDKDILKRVYTQNIDGLYQKTGVPDNMVVEFHGSYAKDNVVIYDDDISEEVIEQVKKDFIWDIERIDLILVMGTSLQVAPFCAIPNLVRKECLRVLVDIKPEYAFNNRFNDKTLVSYVKFGKRKVTLRPQWFNKKRNNLIITEDTDVFSKSIIDKIYYYRKEHIMYSDITHGDTDSVIIPCNKRDTRLLGDTINSFYSNSVTISCDEQDDRLLEGLVYSFYYG